MASLKQKINSIIQQVVQGKTDLSKSLTAKRIPSTPTDEDDTLETFSSYSNKINSLEESNNFRMQADFTNTKSSLSKLFILPTSEMSKTVDNQLATYKLPRFTLILADFLKNTNIVKNATVPASEITTNLKIDWGDGSKTVFNTQNPSLSNLWHEYADNKTYIITLIGKVQKLWFEQSDGSVIIDKNTGQGIPLGSGEYLSSDLRMWTRVKRILSWGNLEAQDIRFYHTLILDNWANINPFKNFSSIAWKGSNEIPEYFYAYLPNITSVSKLFQNYAHETIPANVLEGTNNITDVSMLFYDSKITNINNDLLKDKTKITNVTSFAAASNVTSIYNFNNFPNITSALFAYNNCTKLTDKYITRDYIGMNTNLSSIDYMFSYSTIQNLAGNTLVDKDGNYLIELEFTPDFKYYFDTAEPKTLLNINNLAFSIGDKNYTIISSNQVQDNTSKTIYNIVNDRVSLPLKDKGKDGPYNAFQNLKKLSSMKLFAYSTTLTGDIDSNLNCLPDNVNAYMAFVNSQVQECEHILDYRFKDCVGMFAFTPLADNIDLTGKFNNINTNMDQSNISKWQNCFASYTNTKVPFELGGRGARLYAGNLEGKVLLKDLTVVDWNNYTEDTNNPTIGFIIADVKLNNNNIIDANGSRKVIAAIFQKSNNNMYSTKINLFSKDDLIAAGHSYNVEVNKSLFNGEKYTNIMYDWIAKQNTWDQHSLFNTLYNQTIDGNKLYLPASGECNKLYVWNPVITYIIKKLNKGYYNILSLDTITWQYFATVYPYNGYKVVDNAILGSRQDYVYRYMGFVTLNVDHLKIK